MIKKYNFLFVLLFSLIITREALSENSIIECNSFQGSQISSNGRNVKNSDFYSETPTSFQDYTFFLKSNKMAFTETQTQIMTGLPNIKSFIGNCSVY